MYGGWDGSNKFNHLFIVELGRHSVVSVSTTYDIVRILSTSILSTFDFKHFSN